MPEPIHFPTSKSGAWKTATKGEIYGDLIFTKNIDLALENGKIRLCERTQIIYDDTDSVNFDGSNGFPRAFVRSNADGTDRWWAMVRSSANSVPALYKTTDTNPTTGWTADALSNSPTLARDSMEVFLQSGGNDRLVVPVASGDLSMLSGSW